MPLDPVQQNFDLESTIAPDNLARRVFDHFHGTSRQATKNAHVGSANLGSRLAYRAFGALMKAGRKRLPMIVNWSITEDGSGSQVHVSMKSDEGEYAFAMRWHYQAYEARFAQLETDFRRRFA
jgi:hypothetical protein